MLKAVGVDLFLLITQCHTPCDSHIVSITQRICVCHTPHMLLASGAHLVEEQERKRVKTKCRRKLTLGTSKDTPKIIYDSLYFCSNCFEKWRDRFVDRRIYTRDPGIDPTREGRHVCWVADVIRPARGVPLHALADLAHSESRSSAFSFTFRVSSTRFREDDVYGIARFEGVFDTESSSDERHCYRAMLEAGHFHFDPPATSSSGDDDDDEIVMDELTVVRGDLARACRVEGQRARGREQE